VTRGWQKTSGYVGRQKADAAIGRWKQVTNDELRLHIDEPRAIEVGVAVHVLDHMPALGCPSYVRIG
jgi:hypothetical protein